ncbi:MAG: hypothetical protein M1361_02325 [Patescibacteria group bacterium]|nr:hypothetical protein [Patescibacteria group bacterium]MCL5224416.1 hypothetical protein [Patescibacteria group bacterium]
MAYSLKDNRLKFPPGEQRRFVERAIQKAGSINKLAKYLGVCTRTIRDWRRGKFLIMEESAKCITVKYKLRVPRRTKTQDRFWYTKKGARKGGLASYKAQGGVIGNPEVRRENWRAWWNKEGRYKNNPILSPLPFSKPRKSAKLAEFVGIMMGDGSMNQYQLSIALHHKDDRKFCLYTVRLIKKLFGVDPHIRHRPELSVNVIVVSRSGLIKYLNQLGLPIGNKLSKGLDIPRWIKRDNNFAKACIRGLFDTDGCVVIHRYKVNGKKYVYKKLAFTSLSPDLIESVYGILMDNGLRPRIAQKGRDIRMDSAEQVSRYFKVIGSHNQKHLKRYKSLVYSS